MQVTDFDLHRMWIVPGMQGYFAANDEVAWRMAERSLPEASIHVSGIPSAGIQRAARPGCLRGRVGPRSESHHVPHDVRRPRCARGAPPRHAWRISVDHASRRNESLLSALRKLAQAHPGRLFPIGFTAHVERLMDCSDLVITKPGGLTTSECLTMGLPMIVTSRIPGQEERNADFLLEHGAALKAWMWPRWRIGFVRSSSNRPGWMPCAARCLFLPARPLDGSCWTPCLTY